MFRSDAVIPPDPDGLDVLHDREYRVRSERLSGRGSCRNPGRSAPRWPNETLRADRRTPFVDAAESLTVQRRFRELGRSPDEWPGQDT